MLKYTEKNHRPNGPIWSMRHMAAYQHYHRTTKSSNCILIHASEHLERRVSTLADKNASTELPDHWTILHELWLGTLVQNWREFMQYQLDEFTSGVSETRRRSMFKADFFRTGLLLPYRYPTDVQGYSKSQLNDGYNKQSFAFSGAQHWRIEIAFGSSNSAGGNWETHIWRAICGIPRSFEEMHDGAQIPPTEGNSPPQLCSKEVNAGKSFFVCYQWQLKHNSASGRYRFAR